MTVDNVNSAIEKLEAINPSDSFRCLSNNTLIEIYKNYLENKNEDMERLVLEEIMVEKGILKSSPMHEELYQINKSFLNQNNSL